MHAHNRPGFQRSWLHPRYWPTWLLMALWWLLVQLPYPLLIVMGKGIGRLLLLFGTSRRYVTQCNLELCFPELSAQERKKILVESFESAGIAFFEMGMGWWWPTWRLKRLCKFAGAEHVKNLNGQGGILLGMHFTTIDIAGAGLSLHENYCAMYRSHKNPVFDYVQVRGRSRNRFVSEGEQILIPREDMRTTIRQLKRGNLVWYAPDQDYGKERAVFVPFFGIPAATITVTARLAEMGHARVLPLTHKRLPCFKGYEVTIHPPLENYPTGNELDDAIRINSVVEQHVRKNPGQYLWAHRRFKSRPEGAVDRYPDIYEEQERRMAKRAALRQKNRQ